MSDDIKKAEELIKVEKQNRIINCQNEMNAILEKYNCSISAQVLIKDNQLSTSIVIQTM